MSRRLTVLNVAYPLAPVGRDAVGGAEQVLSQLDLALTGEGHHSIVIAVDGSLVHGTLLPTPQIQAIFTEQARSQARRNHRRAIASAMRRIPIDLIHLHGIDCLEYLPPPGPPVLITLHLPPQWYPQKIFQLDRPQTWLHCVSATQCAECPPCTSLMPEIENGVSPAFGEVRFSKRDFVLALGRICEEKGFHIALDAAARARTPMLLAGEVFGYPAHQDYFTRQIRPRLDQNRRFIGPIGFRQKRRLLGSARCLLAPSLVSETSSLVAMEALASGTPVVGFPSGALGDIIEHGRTGFLVRNMEEMAEAIKACVSLNPEACRRSARERFNLDHTMQKYLATYKLLAASGRLDALKNSRVHSKRELLGLESLPLSAEKVGVHPD